MITAADYDIAAGLLIAEEAGAIISSFDFQNGDDVLTAVIAGESQAVHDRLRAYTLNALDGILQATLKIEPENKFTEFDQ